MSATGRTSLPFDAWPKTDQALWQAARLKGAIFEPDGAAAGWAEATAIQVIKGYGKWLWALQYLGALKPDVTPAARVTEDHLRRYLEVLEGQGLASTSIASRVTDLMEAVRVMEPDADLTLLRSLVSTLQQRAKPSRHKAIRIRPPGEIWNACAAEMRSIADTAYLKSINTASRYRDALVLGFLVWSPIRRRNLAALSLGTNLRYEADRWHVTFRSEDTKDKAPLAFYLPEDDDYNQALTYYLQYVRPRLMKAAEIGVGALPQLRGPLWVSTRGQAISPNGLYYAVTRCSERLLGAPIYPHLLRDCAASALTTERPEQVLAAARILGHSQLATTLDHYEHASMLEAGKRLQEVIEEIWTRPKEAGSTASEDRPEDPYYDPWEDT